MTTATITLDETEVQEYLVIRTGDNQVHRVYGPIRSEVDRDIFHGPATYTAQYHAPDGSTVNSEFATEYEMWMAEHA